MSLSVLLLVSLSALAIISQGKTSHDAQILEKSLEQTPFPRFERATLREEVDRLNAKVKRINRRLNAKVKRMNRRLRQKLNKNPSVAFQVTQTKHPLTLHAQQIYKFDTVVLNNGGGYHKGTGVFEAPVSGTYQFWVNVLPIGRVHAVLYKEDTALFYGDSTRSYDRCTLTYALKLNRGEKIWFKSWNYQTEIYGQTHSGYGGILVSAHT